MNIKGYFGLADKELNNIFGKVEGDVGDKEIANRTLRHFYKESINMKFFIRSTGRDGEYRAFMERFRKKFPNVEELIQENVELEEVIQSNAELEEIE